MFVISKIEVGSKVAVKSDPRYVYKTKDFKVGLLERKIVKITGDWVTLDAPVSTTLERPTKVVHKDRIFSAEDLR